MKKIASVTFSRSCLPILICFYVKLDHGVKKKLLKKDWPNAKQPAVEFMTVKYLDSFKIYYFCLRNWGTLTLPR